MFIKQFIAVFGCGAAIGCAPVTSGENAFTPKSLMGAGSSSPITSAACKSATGQTLTPHPAMQFIIRLNQKKDLLKDLGKSQQIVRNVENSIDHKPVPKPTKNIKNLWTTNLDIPFANTDISRYYTKIIVRLYPQNKNDTLFLRTQPSADPSASTDSSSAITVAPSVRGKFCDRSDVETDSDAYGQYEQITFGTILAPKSNGPPVADGEAASFNIGILIFNKTDSSWYPIYIDPNVQNEG